MFSYNDAFSRNIGWVTEAEQQTLRKKRVAIAGLGGVGGSHLLTLARLGIGRFHVADFDTFEINNFNRQAGATVASLGLAKTDVLARMAKDINPELDIRVFQSGITADNLADFLEDVDLYVDGLDFFAFTARQAVFAACAKYAVPAVTAAPLGMGVAMLSFLPGKMTFEEYFRVRGFPEPEQAIRFLLGVSPAMLQMPYLVDNSRVNFSDKRGPSTGMACQLCAGMAATEGLKILLGRGKVLAAPWGQHFDAYRTKFTRTWRPWGNHNPIQRLALVIARRQFASVATLAQPALTDPQWRPIEKIVDLARWAPSGDNTQPWRFNILDDLRLVVHGFDTRDHCVYDLNGRPSQLAIGAMLETLRIAASGHALRTEIRRRSESEETHPIFDVHLLPAPEIAPSPLIPHITTRSVQRRAMATQMLTIDQKSALEASAGDGYMIVWLDGWRNRLKVARLLFATAKLRLTIPEAYAVHREVIDWQNPQFSPDKVPSRAVGLDPFALTLMRWVMKSWKRVKFFNTYFAGTFLPRVELDLVPGLACAAHFLIVAKKAPPAVIDDYIAAGGAIQRFWLTAAGLGLSMQPEVTPLVFSAYHRAGTRFSAQDAAGEAARNIARSLSDLVSEDLARRAVFMGRIGVGKSVTARSLRLPLRELQAPLAGKPTSTPGHRT
ncbi:MAG: ThiF family adenylyltransferase [Candidatus Accumulibacter necessarius]|jgi:molybdopterin/thiamine biosynthesis adenylyltransferase